MIPIYLNPNTTSIPIFTRYPFRKHNTHLQTPTSTATEISLPAKIQNGSEKSSLRAQRLHPFFRSADRSLRTETRQPGYYSISLLSRRRLCPLIWPDKSKAASSRAYRPRRADLSVKSARRDKSAERGESADPPGDRVLGGPGVG